MEISQLIWALSLKPRHLAFMFWGLLMVLFVVAWLYRWIMDDTK